MRDRQEGWKRHIDGRRGLQFKRRRRPITTMLMYAEAGGVESMTFPRKHPLPPALSFIYRKCTHARFATPTGPPAYNGCAEGCTMANKHARLVYMCVFFNQLVHTGA